jgi:hypothetical protein
MGWPAATEESPSEEPAPAPTEEPQAAKETRRKDEAQEKKDN